MRVQKEYVIYGYDRAGCFQRRASSIEEAKKICETILKNGGTAEQVVETTQITVAGIRDSEFVWFKG